MRITHVLVTLLLGLATTQSAQAQMATALVDDLVKGLIATSAKQCAANQNNSLVKDLEAQGKKAEAFAAATSIQTMCVCMPAHARTLLAKMSAGQREARVTESEFTEKYLSKIMNPCAGEQLKAQFGAGCAERMAPYRPSTARYCSCMDAKMNELSETQLGQMAKENAAYMPVAAEAQKKGLPLPKRPPALEQMRTFDTACAAG